MLRNNLRIGLRNLFKQKGFSLINIIGLAMGIACFLLIFLYVRAEFSYDRMHKDADRIHRITSTVTFGGRTSMRGTTGHADSRTFAGEIPEIASLVRMDNGVAIIRKGDDYLEERRLVYADPQLFEVFDFEILSGDPATSLNEPGNLVITRRTAIKYFGTTDVVGRSLEMNVEEDAETFSVSAVMEDHPDNSSFVFEMVLPWSKRVGQIPERRLNSWSNVSLNSFVKLSTGASIALVEDKMKAVRAAHNPGEEGSFARSIENKLQPLTSIHLDTEIGGGDGLGLSADASDAYLLSAIAFIILIVACINFANLSIARALPRAREIGVRKVLGAGRKQLAIQFLNEALLMSLMAFVLGIILAELCLSVFANLTERSFSGGLITDFYTVFACIGLVLLTALMAGLYPALVISRFDTVKSLKGKVRLGGSWVSKSLVVLQFTIAAVLIVGVLAMNKQVDFMIDMDLGYDDQHLIEIDAYGSGQSNVAQLLEDELNRHPAIEAVAAADDYSSRTATAYNGNDFLTVLCDAHSDYPEILSLELLEGRFLKPGSDMFYGDTDTLTNVLVNEAFVQEAGMDEPLHKTTRRFRIVGVFKDFHFRSVQDPITPLIYVSQSENQGKEFERLYVKYNEAYASQIQSVLADAWFKIVPDRPFQYELVADANALRYEEETRWQAIITYASILAISISILGLFGLAHLATQQRTKEIGIRKVLGASFAQILILLNSDFSKMVLISVLLASPIAWFFIHNWLENFANQTEVTLWLFFVPAVAVLLVALITVSLQSLKSIFANPVNALRYE